MLDRERAAARARHRRRHRARADRDAGRRQSPDPARLLRRRDPRLVAAGLEGPRRRLRDPGAVPQHRVPRGPPRRGDRSRSTTSPAASTSGTAARRRASSRSSTRPGATSARTQAEVSLIDGGLLAQGPAGANTRYMLGAAALDDRLRAAVADPGQRRPVADHGAELLGRAVPHRSRAVAEVAARAVERRHRRHVRAVRDEERGREGQAVLQPHALPAPDRPARATTTGRGRANLALSGLLQEFMFEAGVYQYIRRPPAAGHAARRGHAHREARRRAVRRACGAPAPSCRSAAARSISRSPSSSARASRWRRSIPRTRR